MPIRRIDKTLTATTATIAGEDIAASSIPVKPHIQPGVLQPAIAGKLLNGASHSGAYGTAQTQSGGDGHSYYYTDIKGSGPIKDPRIGAHFGSQRHTFRSMQKLEQETAIHGEDVYSIDGRESCRMVNVATTSNMVLNDDHGLRLKNNGQNQDGEFYEIVSYFNDMNVLVKTYADSDHRVKFSLNGAAYGSNVSGLPTTVHSPIGGRYVDASSVVNLAVGATLGINTVKINTGTEVYGIELIAQDTSSTANRSKIQIPSQNVVSYGKKFSVSAAAHHYDPFNGFTNDTTLFSSKVDTATSLGLGTATTWGCAWDKGSDNHIRPLNGGRVVKWIDSTGAIKTSVTMMPRNAQNKDLDDDNEITTASATNTHTINFSNDAIDHSLAEVARVYHVREFGNGAANQGAGGTYADTTMLYATDNVSYVMDDGLTSISAKDVVNTNTSGTKYSTACLIAATTSMVLYVTFIGTGFAWKNVIQSGTVSNYQIVQNLPYGTHVVKFNRSDYEVHVDGVHVQTVSSADGDWAFQEFTIYQPKKPPIPEDACIIADYMLMADYVKSTNTTAKVDDLSKGIRLQAASKDVLYDRSGGSWDSINNGSYPSVFITPLVIAGGNATSLTAKLPYFGFTKGALSARRATDATDLAVTATNSSGSIEATNVTVSTRVVPALSANIADLSHTGNVYGFFNWEKSDGVLGSNTVSFDDANLTSTFDWMYLSAMEIATPIHSSSHYQAFETPYLHELVGGDRNMEQTNLIVTSDGKSWDEVTRDTSYLGNVKVRLARATTDGSGWYMPYEIVRGTGGNAKSAHFNKDFAVAYNKYICLVDGFYEIYFHVHNNASLGDSDWRRIEINGARLAQSYGHDQSSAMLGTLVIGSAFLNRGDYVQVHAASMGGDEEVNFFEIKRV